MTEITNDDVKKELDEFYQSLLSLLAQAPLGRVWSVVAKNDGDDGRWVAIRPKAGSGGASSLCLVLGYLPDDEDAARILKETKEAGNECRDLVPVTGDGGGDDPGA